MNISIRVHPKFSKRILQRRLAEVVYKVLRQHVSDVSISIYITTDAEIHKLNRQFHATDAPTDVLSFPTGNQDFLGDIVISYDRAKTQAHDAGWRIADELDLLATHGVLHLLGYDDRTPRKRAKMWAKQAEILGRTIPVKESK